MMKYVLIVLSLFALASCSQTAKKKESPQKEESSAQAPSGDKEVVHQKKVDNPSFKFKSVEAESTCSLKSDTRKLAHVLLEGGGCAVNYTKFGKEAQIAKAKFDYSFCNNTYNRVKTKLEEAGFSCE